MGSAPLGAIVFAGYAAIAVPPPSFIELVPHVTIIVRADVGIIDVRPDVGVISVRPDVGEVET